MGSSKETLRLQAKDDSKRGFNSVKKNISGLDRVAKKASAGVAGIAGGVAVAGIATLAKKTIDAADAVEKLGRRTGGSAKFLSEMRFALSQNDVGLEEFGTSLRKINKSAQDAADGLSTPKRAFEKLGISVSEFGKLNTDEKFITLSEAISKIEDPAIRTQASMDIMGRSGAQLLTVMEAGAAGLTAYREEAVRMGMSLSEDQVKGAAAANDAMDRLTTTVAGAVSQSILPYTQSIVTAADFTREYLPKAIEFLVNVFRGMKLVVQTVVRLIVDSILTIVELAESIPLVGDKFEGVGDTLRTVSETMRDQFDENIKAMAGQTDATDEVSEAQEDFADIASRKYVPALKDVVVKTDKATGSTKKLKEELTLAEKINKRYTGELDSFKEELAFAERAADLTAEKIKLLRDQIELTGDPTGALQDKLKDFSEQTDKAGEVTETTTELIKGKWEDAKESVFGSLEQLFRGGLDGFKNFKDAIVDTVKDMIAAIAATLVRSGLQKLFADIFGGGKSGSFGDVIGSLFGSGGGKNGGGNLAGDVIGQVIGQGIKNGATAVLSGTKLGAILGIGGAATTAAGVVTSAGVSTALVTGPAIAAVEIAAAAPVAAPAAGVGIGASIAKGFGIAKTAVINFAKAIPGWGWAIAGAAALYKLFGKGGRSPLELGLDQLNAVNKALEEGRTEAVQLSETLSFRGGFNEFGYFFDVAGKTKLELQAIGDAFKRITGADQALALNDTTLRIEDFSRKFSESNELIVQQLQQAISEVENGSIKAAEGMRGAFSGVLNGVNLGTPRFSMQGSGGVPTLGNFYSGGSFTVPNTGRGTGDKPFVIGLSAGERVSVSPTSGAANKESSVGSIAGIDELVAAVNALVSDAAMIRAKSNPSSGL